MGFLKNLTDRQLRAAPVVAIWIVTGLYLGTLLYAPGCGQAATLESRPAIAAQTADITQSISLPPELSGVSSVALSPGGRQIALVDFVGNLRFWSLATGPATQPSLLHRGAIRSLYWAADGRLLTGGFDGKVSVQAANKLLELWQFQVRPPSAGTPGFNATPSITALTATSGYIYAGRYSRELDIWSRSGEWVGRVPSWENGPPASLTLSPDGKLLVVGFFRGDMRVYALQADGIPQYRQVNRTGPEIRFSGSGGVEAAAFSPNGQLLATAHGTNEIRLWGVASGRLVNRIFGVKEREYTKLAWSPDGTTLALAGLEQPVELWSVMPNGTTRYLNELELLSGDCRLLHFTSRRRLIAVSSRARILIWRFGVRQSGQ